MAQRKIRPICLWAIFAGCFLYGCGFFLVFAVADILWVQIAAGFLGVVSITLLPVLYGFCYRRLQYTYAIPAKVCFRAVEVSFACLGAALFFSLPVVYCLGWYSAGSWEGYGITYILAMFLLFHGFLWYQFFVVSR